MHKNDAYLFDTVLGCVYIIQKMPASLNDAFSSRSQNLVLKRSNVPYERFFNCNYTLPKNWPYDLNRCETTVDSPLVTKVINETTTTESNALLDETGWVVLLVVVFVLLVALIALGGFGVFKGMRVLGWDGTKVCSITLERDDPF